MTGTSIDTEHVSSSLGSPISPIGGGGDNGNGVVLKKEEDGSPSTPSPSVPGPTAASLAASVAGGGESGVVKANKGMILRKSVEYIRYVLPFFSRVWKLLTILCLGTYNNS